MRSFACSLYYNRRTRKWLQIVINNTTRGGVRLSHFFPLDAEYEISVEAGPGASGFMRRAPGPVPGVDLTVDGRAVPLQPPSGPPKDTPTVNGPARIKVAAGQRTITAALVDPTSAAGVNDLYSTFPRKARSSRWS